MTERPPSISVFVQATGAYVNMVPMKAAGFALICTYQQKGQQGWLLAHRNMVAVADRPGFDAWFKFLSPHRETDDAESV